MKVNLYNTFSCGKEYLIILQHLPHLYIIVIFFIGYSPL